MRAMRTAWLVILGGCATANDYFPPLQIISGHAVIVGAEARDPSGTQLLKDLSSEYTGYLEGGSEQLIHGSATIDGTTTEVSGRVITVTPNKSYQLDLQGLPPNLWQIHTDPGDPLHYTLVSVNPTNLDLDGDAVPESVRLFLYLDKAE